MSTLNLIWTNPTPHSICGYRADYRRKGEQVEYSQLLTSGSTSGTTNTYVLISAPANYEGAIYTDCCSGSTSAGDPYAVNAYSPISFVVTTSGTTSTGTLSSLYPNPYDTLVAIELNYTISGTPHTFTDTATYEAGRTSKQAFSTVIPGGVVVSYSITAIAPVFDNGGQLQQFDPISTPPYFQFYNGSIPQTSGSPMALPSFTLDAFIVTERDVSDVPTAGNLLVSWGQEIIYANGVTPYDNFLFTVKDASGSTLGTTTTANDSKGLRELTIPLIKVILPLDTNQLYTMTIQWDNGAQIGSAKSFYLPDFS